jgi:hypothetical protein
LIVVVAVNDEKDPRPVLKGVGDVMARGTACISLAVKNESLVPWRMGFNGECIVKQIRFVGEGDIESDFGVAGVFSAGVSYGGDEQFCNELYVRIASGGEDKGVAEEIVGRVEIGDPRVNCCECEYKIILHSSDHANKGS